ncbi:MAG: hypothetical protein NTZ09_13835 [Candidatus Hydrogenedentes bacterium]|nr:hypothetical protein [Candidatus Hydrogenedentota bacterium]
MTRFFRLVVFLLLLGPMCLTLLWASYLYRVGRMPLTGDEPHYLLIADSIVRDGDLNVRNNYENDATRSGDERILRVDDWREHTVHLYGRADALYGKHEPGLSLLLAIPYALYGIAGAKYAMVILIGLTPFLFFWVARRIVDHTGWALAIALSLSLGEKARPSTRAKKFSGATSAGGWFISRSALPSSLRAHWTWCSIACIGWAGATSGLIGLK